MIIHLFHGYGEEYYLIIYKLKRRKKKRKIEREKKNGKSIKNRETKEILNELKSIEWKEKGKKKE